MTIRIMTFLEWLCHSDPPRRISEALAPGGILHGSTVFVDQDLGAVFVAFSEGMARLELDPDGSIAGGPPLPVLEGHAMELLSGYRVRLAEFEAVAHAAGYRLDEEDGGDGDD